MSVLDRAFEKKTTSNEKAYLLHLKLYTRDSEEKQSQFWSDQCQKNLDKSPGLIERHSDPSSVHGQLQKQLLTSSLVQLPDGSPHFPSPGEFLWDRGLGSHGTGIGKTWT
ncbi:hypothetical protein RRG08_056814 [Elysia crispata]|uniref:Uncharacterized protein n=1 Tax=Elysia crispata TaxID=231223 RepID=A0AAE1DX78_9GAST|nr:hypothetical protein RRG08_056814 [Elysia crispata]